MPALEVVPSPFVKDPLVATFEIGKPLPQRLAYQLQAQARKFWRLSDKAGHSYPKGKDALGEPLLIKHEREEEADFKRRKRMSKVRRYVRSIIDRYNDHACRQPVNRPKPGENAVYDQLTADCDGTMMPLAVTMRRALRRSQVESTAYLLADTSATDQILGTPGALRTKADDAVQKVRPYIRRIKADQVPWWRDWHSEIVEALILMADETGKTFGWYVTRTITRKIDYEERTDGLVVTAVGPEVPHTYGGCPLVRLSPVFDDEDDNEDTNGDNLDSMAAPIAESQKRIFHIDSMHMEELGNSTFTTHVITGLSEKQLGKVTLGSNRILCIPMAGAQVENLGADPTQAATLRDSMSDEVQELYRVAGLSPGNPLQTGAPESGVSKAFAFNEVEAKLSALADAAEDAENKVVRRACAGVGAPYPGDAAWPESFESPDLASELDFLIKTVSSPLPDTLKREQMKRYMSQAFKLDDATTAEALAEIEAYETPPATALPAETLSTTESGAESGA